ncbi:MAG: hypothetical protein LBG27_03625 [Spirochaetaceae bacterium]|jgi:hypothetical protein|nr:hypothetical protein [Spirochaetaceae bacterium]
MKQKRISLCLEILFFIILMGLPSCSSLPFGIGETNPVESDDSPVETITDDEGQPAEPSSLAETVEVVEAAEEPDDGEAAVEVVETVIENGFVDIQKRAEEDLAYLDTPVNPDLPEPVYLFPDDEVEIADAEPISEPEEPAVLAGDAEPPFGLESEETADPLAEIANGTITGESDASNPEKTIPVETIVEEPPLPASLLPPREVSAVSPPRPRGSAMPASLPQQPARVPASETDRGSGEKDAPPIARTVQTMLGETVEIPLPGSGWVYLGEANEQRGLSYQRRRVSVDGQVFVFRPESAGSYRLKFKKQDLLRGTDTDAVIEVTTVEKAGAIPVDVATAEKAVPKEAIALVPVSATEFVPGEDEHSSPPPVTAMIGEENPAVIAAMIDDAALWNRGRELEAPGASRDMKGALVAYKTLIRNYPQSEYYSGSQKRIAHIERFFVNIH